MPCLGKISRKQPDYLDADSDDANLLNAPESSHAATGKQYRQVALISPEKQEHLF